MEEIKISEIKANPKNPRTIMYQKLLKSITDFITKRHPEADSFYDLFGGGGAMSFMALQIPQFQNVYYNEKNKQIVDLIRYNQHLPKDKSLYKLGEVLPDKLYEWVDRETFHANRERTDWYGGFISTCWSFGNKGTGYLFGTDIEEPKRLAHMVCVYKDVMALKELNKLFPISTKILTLSSIYSRRMFFRKCVVDAGKRFDLQQLEQLQRLERLQRLEQLQRLELSNLDYKDFDLSKIKPTDIVYLDPPYINTANYKTNTINYEEFYEWVNKIKAHVYISSYECPLKVVRRMKHTSILAQGHNDKVYEKLFYINGNE
jgi:site-specific DNA-adenine methylase